MTGFGMRPLPSYSNRDEYLQDLWTEPDPTRGHDVDPNAGWHTSSDTYVPPTQQITVAEVTATIAAKLGPDAVVSTVGEVICYSVADPASPNGSAFFHLTVTREDT